MSATNLNSELPNVSFDLGTLDAGSGSFVKFERERIQLDKEQHYRILPPFGENAKGSLFHRYSIHWGFTGERGQQKPVACSYPTEGFCPVCKRVWDAEDEMKRAQEAGDQAAIKELTTYLKTWRAWRFFIYNAVTIDGRVVMLEIPKTAHDQLMELIKGCVYREEGAFDPTSLTDGVWFTLTKTGKMFETKYKTWIKKIIVDPKEGLEKPDRTPIPEETMERVMAQLKENKGDGPIRDIHDLYETRSSRELQSFLDGELVPDKKKVDGPKEESKLADQIHEPSEEEDVPKFDTPSDPQLEVERLNKLQASEA
jgi:hypothetical protein